MVSDKGYKFILNYQDCLSKYVILRPLKAKTVAEVADCLLSIFFEHGPPSILHTDNGIEFSNKTLMPGLMNSGRTQRSCTAGHAIRRTRGVWSG